MVVIPVIPCDEWLPDRASFGAPVTVATNVLPWVDGYKSFHSLSVVSTNALTAKFQGGTFARDTASNVYLYVGDATKLYSYASSAFSDVSRLVGGAYTVANDDWWEMIQWGNTVIAVNGHTDVPQAITLGAANFAALAGSPPKARHIAIIRDFVVLGNVNDGTAYPSRVQWSGINNSASWTVSAATQADYQDLQGDGGWIQKIIGGENGLVFQERAVWKMTYIGSPEIFQFSLVEKNRGAFAPQGVVAWGNMVFYLADDGFYQLTGGSSSEPIGDGKVDRYFLNDYQSGNAHLITASIDPVNKVVMWAYPGASFTAGSTNQVLCYNWVYKKWTLVTVDLEGFLRYAAQGYTLDSLDTLSTSIDALTTSLDSRLYTGGAMTLAGFNTSHKAGTFTGTAMDATVTVGEKQLNKGQRTQVQEIRPLVDGNTASITIGTRNLLSDTVSYATSISQNASGFCPARSNANYHRFKINTTGSFNFIQGIQVSHTSVGGGR